MPEFLNSSFRNWTGKWIWCKESQEKNSFAYFRKEFQVDHEKQVRIYMTADTRYRLYINGTYVRTGPVQSQPYNQYFDEEDITRWLVKGINVLAVEVYYGGHIQDTRGGLLIDIEDENGNLLAASGEDFKTKKADAWSTDTWGQWINRFAPYQEVYDARMEPEGWKTWGFDDKSWENASVIGGRNGMNQVPAEGPWSRISRRPIPDIREYRVHPEVVSEEECLYLMNRFRPQDLSISLSQAASPITYSSVVHKKEEQKEVLEVICGMDGAYGGVYNPVILLDFGQEVTAYFELELDGYAGQKVEIGYAERLVNGHFNNVLEAQFADSYILKDGRQTFRAFNWRGYRYVRLIFKDCMKPLRICNIYGVVTEYPFEDRGEFSCKDSWLNEVFDICKTTIKLCCNEAIVDTPWREQSQWMGDVAAVTLGGIYGLYGDCVLPGKFLMQSAANQLPTGLISNVTNTTAEGYLGCMVDYNFWWVISVWEHYLYTGDELLFHRLYPVVCRIMMAADEFRDVYGMLNRMPYTIFLDWAANDKRGECAALNALYYGTLEAVEKMAVQKKDFYMVEHAREAKEKIQKNFSGRFWQKEKQVFVDSNDEEVLSETISEAANMLAIYFGLANEEQSVAIIEQLMIKKELVFVEACPFLGFYTLRALAKVKRVDLALEMIKEKWYGRFVAKGILSTVEEWSMNGSYRNGTFLPIFRSLSHAWSAGPAEFLLKDLNQIKVLEPGGKKVSVIPQTLPMDYRLVYPLQNGEVEIIQKDGTVRCEAHGMIEVVMEKSDIV